MDYFLERFPPRFFTVKLVCFIGFLGSSYIVLFTIPLCMILIFVCLNNCRCPTSRRRTIGAFVRSLAMATLLRVGPLEAPFKWWCMCVRVCSGVCSVVHAGLRVLSLSQWRKVSLPLVLWQESEPNFKGLPKVSGVTINHWFFSKVWLVTCL